MDINFLLLLSPIIALFGNVMIYVICIHLGLRYALSLLGGLLAGLFVDTWLLVMLNTQSHIIATTDIVVSVATYSTCSFCFWAFLNLNITSLRIRIVRELLYKNEIGLSNDELSQQYSPQEFAKRRIERLAATGQIVNSAGKWQLNSKVLIFVERVFFFLNKLIIPYKSNTERKSH